MLSPIPYPYPPALDGRNGPEIMSGRADPAPQPVAAFRTVVPKSLLGNTAELILLAGVQVSQPCVLERRSGCAALWPAAANELIRAMLESSHWW